VNYYDDCGWSINVVTRGERGYQRFFDDSTEALRLKIVTIGRGSDNNCPKLCNVIYG
jgi:hypothetical protein